MKFRCAWLLPAVFVALAFLPRVETAPPHNNSRLLISMITATTSGCLDDNGILADLQLLSTAQTFPQQQSAQNRLIDDAKKSPQCRKRIIGALMSALDGATANVDSDRAGFYLWHYGSEILSTLKAEEALDFLIQHLDVDDGTPFPLNHHPALVSVTRMGSVAIPKLSAALRKSSNPNSRQYAVFCIAAIGGADAKKVLAEALPSEPNKCVSSFIKASLDAFKNSSVPDQIDPEKRTNWYTSFLCNAR